MERAVQQSLTREQKEAVGLLSIGTFLEYFDLMLYVHMAVLLNELFFPKADPFTASLLAAFAFCSTYILRPFGALLFGYIGDNIGRKHTVIITTFMMATSCTVMAVLPTYAQIGITASWLVTICRVIQGMSSMGEIIGAQIYLTETIKRPIQYPIVALLSLLAALGGVAALGIASLVTIYHTNWRYAFWFGALVAVIGTVARTSLRETPDFVNVKTRLKRTLNTINKDISVLSNQEPWKEKINPVHALNFFLIQCGWPICFYIAFIHCSSILQSSFGYSPEQVIHQNFFLAIIEMVGVFLLMVVASCYVYPIIILKVKLIIFSIIILLSPYFLENATSPFEVFCVQGLIMFFVLEDTPAKTIFFDYFPILRRFTSAAFLYAVSRAVMFVITSFGCVYFTNLYGNYGLLIIVVPILIFYTLGVLHFQRLEKEAGKYRRFL